MQYDMSGEHGVGITRSGVVFLFDKDDYDRISQHSWCLSGSGYIHGCWGGKTVKLHRFIMGCNDRAVGVVIDHVNHNKLDNRKKNLRLSTVQQNNANKTYMGNNTSGKIGVYWNKKKQRWIAQIKYNGINYYVGCFKVLEDAVEAREEAERHYFGECPNDNEKLT